MKLNVGSIFKMETQKTEQIQENLIHKDMTMGEILQKFPATAEVMMNHGLHCVGCHVATWETLEQGIIGHGGNSEQIESLVRDMNEFVKNQKFSDNKDIALTSRAAEKLKEILKQHSKKTGLKIEVLEGGCAGFSYNFTLVDAPKEEEITIEQLGVKIYIDDDSLSHINGAKIDYIEALQGAGFKVSNPKAVSTCGCGQSFS